MLAVLPFENLGAEEDEYFADGITDEITSRVGILNGLGVIARTSILQYKGTTKRISEIGSELNVDYILEGTIRWDKSGDVDKVRITPQLIRVSDETHLWADNLQRDLSEIFEVQEEIAISIAEALNVALLTDDQEALDYRPTENLAAYDFYLRAINFTKYGDQLGAIELLEKATKLDSSFALAFALKSQTHSFFAFFNESGFSEHTKPARLAYIRAFEIQPDLAEGHLARGVYYNLIERDYDKALKEFELAQRGYVDKASVLNEIALVKLRQGEWREAINLAKRVMKLDPQSFTARLTIIQASWYTHQYDNALEELEPMISLGSGWGMPYSFKAQVQICMGADVEQIQKTLSEWSANGMSRLSVVEGPLFLDFLRRRNHLPDLNSLIIRAKSALQHNPDPALYVNTGLFYSYMGDVEASYLYLDSARAVIENRFEEARNDTTGRFEAFPVEHSVYELLALVYSQTERHKQAIEHAQLAIESMPIKACHW
jgi:TolB-like protein